MVVAALLGIGALVAGFGALSVQAGGKKSDSEVKVTVSGEKPDASGKQLVTVTMVHNKGWHSYANPVGNEDFTSAQTVVNVTAKVKPASVKVAYPAGKVHKDKVVGEYKVYENKVEIPVLVQRAEGDTSPLEVSVRFMACHDKGVCLLPATVKKTVP
jgi:thiol:disulfide interchange protein